MASPFADPDVLFGLELKEPWASMVLDGSKTIETRGYDLPAELIDRPLVLLATPEHSGSAGHSGLADVVTDRGAATILGLVTFGGVVEWESREAWAGIARNTGYRTTTMVPTSGARTTLPSRVSHP